MSVGARARVYLPVKCLNRSQFFQTVYHVNNSKEIYLSHWMALVEAIWTVYSGSVIRRPSTAIRYDTIPLTNET